MRHYEGEIGTFDYDENVWGIIKEKYNPPDVLQLKEGYKGKISLPKGVKSCCYMFHQSDLTGCWFEDFDTSDVENTMGMFLACKIPEGFSLGDKFDTSSVNNMKYMFQYCTLPKGFSLGDKFDTSNVTNMNHMFSECRIPEGFSLGDKFDTSNVKDMSYMFFNCELPERFSLGDKFDTSSVNNMKYMFQYCTLPKGFSLGDKFDTSNVTNMNHMFTECRIPEGFSLGDKFDTSSVEDMRFMFYGCYIGNKVIKDAKYTEDMEDIIKSLKKPTNNTKNNQEIDNIIKEIQRLVKEGKTKEAKESIKELSKYTDEKTIVKSLANSIPLDILSEGIFLGNSSSITAKKYIEKEIIPSIDSMFFTKDKNRSSYTVGEVLDILYKEHDVNIVNAAMCEYLRHQYIEND